LVHHPRTMLLRKRGTVVPRAVRGTCAVSLLVVAPDADVAAWCAEPIETGIPGFVLRPPVLGRAAVPVVTDPAEAPRRNQTTVVKASS
jgi:hypothetical protein